MAKRIATIEDDQTIRQNYCDALVRAGYEIETFSGLAEVHNAFRHNAGSGDSGYRLRR